MPYNVFLLPQIPVGKRSPVPHRISALLNDYAEKALVITLDDNFPGKYFYPKTVEFVERHKVSDSFLLDKIRDGDYSLVVLYDCFFAYNGIMMADMLEITQGKDNLLLVNVLPLNSAVKDDPERVIDRSEPPFGGFLKTGIFQGETAERIDFPDWEREHLHICSAFSSKTNLYEKSQLFPDMYSPNDKPFTYKELYKREFHFYRLLQTYLCCSAHMIVFSLFLNELSLELRQVNIESPLLETLETWSKITYKYRFFSIVQRDEYIKRIQEHVRKIMQTNVRLFDQIRDFFTPSQLEILH